MEDHTMQHCNTRDEIDTKLQNFKPKDECTRLQYKTWPTEDSGGDSFVFCSTFRSRRNGFSFYS